MPSVEGQLDALNVVEFAATAIVSGNDAAVVPVTPMFNGFGMQVMPTCASDVAAVVNAHVTATLPVNPAPVGVAVIVEVPLPPGAIGVAAVPVSVKAPLVGAVIVKFTTCVEVPPPGGGFVTVTSFVPTVTMSVARIDAVSCVALTNVVVLAAPPKFTTETPFTKFVPLTVRLNVALPAAIVVGLIVVTVGTGLFAAVTVKFTAGVDVPPPGAGFVTVTGLVPAVAMSVARIDAVS
jgi:hypothetical protein